MFFIYFWYGSEKYDRKEYNFGKKVQDDVKRWRFMRFFLLGRERDHWEFPLLDSGQRGLLLGFEMVFLGMGLGCYYYLIRLINYSSVIF